MPQMIEDAEKEHDVEASAEGPDVIGRHLGEFDVYADNLRGKPCLPQIIRIDVDSENAGGAPQFHLNRIEPGITADVEHSLAGEIGGDRIGKPPPFDGRIVTEEMARCGHDPAQID